MEHTALILISITLLLLVIIIGILTFMFYKFLKNGATAPKVSSSAEIKDSTPSVMSKAEFHPAIQERIKELEKIKIDRSNFFCANHPEEPGEIVCGICDELFCPSCVKSFKTLHFCKEHLPLLMRHEWTEVMTIKSSTHDPERGVRLYDFKKEIYRLKELPTYIETHYKINVDQDFIETYLVLFAIKESYQDIENLIPDNVKN